MHARMRARTHARTVTHVCVNAHVRKRVYRYLYPAVSKQMELWHWQIDGTYFSEDKCRVSVSEMATVFERIFGVWSDQCAVH